MVKSSRILRLKQEDALYDAGVLRDDFDDINHNHGCKIFLHVKPVYKVYSCVGWMGYIVIKEERKE